MKPDDAHTAAPSAAELWHGFREGLWAFVVRRAPSHADAEDLLQEIFLRLHTSVAQLERQERVQAWVFAIARRTLADFYRARYRRPAVEARAVLEDLPEFFADPAVETEAALSPRSGEHDVHEEVLSWLRPMIEALPETDRVALRMADVEGRTQQEVADRLGLSLSGAKSRVQRARARLGALLARCCEVEFGPEGRAVAFRRLHAGEDPCTCHASRCA